MPEAAADEMDWLARPGRLEHCFHEGNAAQVVSRSAGNCRRLTGGYGLGERLEACSPAA